MSHLEKIKMYFNKERLFILGVVVLFYFNALKNGYSLDDSIVTEPGNLTAQGIKAIPKLLKSFYIGSSEDYQFEYRPLVKVAFAVEHEFFGVNPKTSHFFNILLYIVGLFLFYKVLGLLFKNENKHLPFYITVLFAALPIHTEVVTSIKNRDIILCFIFSLLGLKQYYFFYESQFKKWKHLIFSVFLFYFAFLSKYDVLPYLVIVPVVFLAKDNSKFKWVVISIAFLYLSLVLFKYTRKGLVDVTESKRLFYFFENPLYSQRTIGNKLIAMVNCLGFYILQCIYPLKQVCYYGYKTIFVLKLDSYGYLGIAAIPVLGYGLIRTFFKKEVVIFTGLIMFCASISMYLNIAKPAVGIVADRYTFFASMGFCVTVVGLIFKYFHIKADLPVKFKWAGVVILLIYALNVIQRNADWKDINTLVSADIKKYPENAYLNYKQGMNIIKEAEANSARMSPDQRKYMLMEGRKYLEKSIEMEPNYANSRNYLSYVLVYLLNDFKAALPHVNSSLDYKETVELYFYKAIIMRETQQKDSAEFYLKKCINMNDRFYNAYSLLMYDYNLNKEYIKSLDMFNEALKKGVSTEEIHLGLAKTYEEMGNKPEAINQYKEIIKINPGNNEAKAYLSKLEAN